MNWLRLHHEARNDKKLQALSDKQFRVWFNLLCYSGEQKDRGVIVFDDPYLLAIEVSRGDVDLLLTTIAQLVKLRIITSEIDQVAFINFNKRQYDKPSDAPERVAERVAEHRKRQGNAPIDDVTPRNATVTPRNTHPSRDRTDTDTDTETEQSTPPTPSAEGGAPPNKTKRKPIETTIPEDFAVTESMRSNAKARFGLTDEQIDAKTERFKTWAAAKGQTYVRWDQGWLNFMEPKSWDQNDSPRSNGRASPRSITANHAGEDRAYLERGLPPVWGSANGGIDSL